MVGLGIILAFGERDCPLRSLSVHGAHPALYCEAALRDVGIGPERILYLTDDPAEAPLARAHVILQRQDDDSWPVEQALSVVSGHPMARGAEYVVVLNARSPFIPPGALRSALDQVRAAGSGVVQSSARLPGMEEDVPCPVFAVGCLDDGRPVPGDHRTHEVPARLALDLADPLDRAWAEFWLRQPEGAALNRAGKRAWPAQPRLLVMDFDGVLTDNRVWVDGQGREQVAAYRSDSLGLKLLRRAGVEALVISMETDPVVAARCNKMKVPYLQGVDDKAPLLAAWLAEHGYDPAEVVYLGNDVNDLGCFAVAGFSAAPVDAEPAVRAAADWVLTRGGGRGAVRELCDLLLQRLAVPQAGAA